MKYELKNIKTLNTSDGVAWTATVYKDGKRIGTAEDRGDGGSARLYVSDRAEEVSLVEWAREEADGSGLWMEEYTKRTIKVHHVGGDKDGTQGYEPQFDVEMALAYLMEVADLNKKAKSAIVFRVSKGVDPRIGEEYNTYTLKNDRPWSHESVANYASALMYIEGKYPTAQMWDVATASWSSVSEIIDHVRPALTPKVGA